ncbi:hypothetical protein [Hyperthermus butylicus]|uniref:hypothetical protein n=1 Tax=Hyperthermus butylicus TaxID=54248 RepID=UPI00064FDD95|nr:hypothetical protein [Hyperthermus butylicus]
MFKPRRQGLKTSSTKSIMEIVDARTKLVVAGVVWVDVVEAIKPLKPKRVLAWFSPERLLQA